MVEGTLGVLGFALGCVLLLAGPAAAQTSGSASASVDPGTVQAGDDLELVFNVTSPEAGEISIQEEIRCTVTFPSDLEENPCENQSTVGIRLPGGQTREFRFPYTAPDEVGTYQVDFNATNDLSVPPTSYEAETSFEVVSAEELQSATEDGTSDNGTTDDDTGDQTPPTDEDTDEPADPPDEGDDSHEALGGNTAGPGPDDEARMLISTTASVAALTGGLVAIRWPIGG